MKKKIRIAPPGSAAGATVLMLIGSVFLFVYVFGSNAVVEMGAFVNYVKQFGTAPPEYFQAQYSLSTILAGRFFGLWIHLAVCAALAVKNYAGFHTNSKSIYTMKRIASPLEIHRLSLLLPVTGALAGIVVTMLIMLELRGDYISVVPAGWPESYKILDLWRILL